MTTLDLMTGLMGQSLARDFDLMKRMNALIYAKASGLTAQDLGQVVTVVLNQEQPGTPAAPVQATPPPATVPAATARQGEVVIVEQQQPDGSWLVLQRIEIP